VDILELEFVFRVEAFAKTIVLDHPQVPVFHEKVAEDDAKQLELIRGDFANQQNL
jgi:hypothetical protein